jgi:DNA-binding response OmpR family regulator/GGDEF domain-containing protein
VAARGRILAIDDQRYFRDFLVGLLAEEGYDVVATPSGADTAATLDAATEAGAGFDLILLDAMSHRGGVADAVAELRLRAPDAALIVLTGAADLRAAVRAMQEGASDYLLKPIDRAALLAAIHRILHEGGAGATVSHLRDESLAFTGRLSLLERLLAVVTRPDLRDLASGLLELCAVEACATRGDMWVHDATADAWSRLAAIDSGGARAADLEEIATDAAEDVTAPDHEAWLPAGSAVRKTLAGGLAAIAHSPGGDVTGPCLFIPFSHVGQMLAVARLAARAAGDFGEPDAHAALEVAGLGASALANALAAREASRERVRDPRTGLPTRAHFVEVLETETHKAHRFGRRLCCVCIDVPFAEASASVSTTAWVESVVTSLSSTLRTTDVLCSEGLARYWVLVTDTDPLGGVVLKRRLTDRVRNALRAVGCSARAALGLASYPLDGETRTALMECAIDRSAAERESEVHTLGFDARAPLSVIGERLLARGVRMPATLPGEVAELLIGELACHPQDTGLLFMAPGNDPAPIIGPLMAMGDAETATEVFLASDGDTVPACSALTAVALPPGFATDTTWLVRFGEAPAYALLAGPPGPDGTRTVFHSTDPVLVEHLTFGLCAEVGIGVRA